MYCKYCLDTGNDYEMVTPCNCKGSLNICIENAFIIILNLKNIKI